MDVDVDMDINKDMDVDVDMDMEMDTDSRHDFLQTERNRNSICFGSVSVFFAKLSGNGHDHFSFCFGLFRLVFGCFGYIETPKQAVLILKRNNRNKRFR